MTDITIHSIMVSYDQDDERVRQFINYLKNKKEEMLAYYRSAKEIHPEEKYILILGNEYSLVCDSSHKCVLKLRGM